MVSHVEIDTKGRKQAVHACTEPYIILRYEIERDVILGQLEVKEIPQRWNHLMMRYLGLDTSGNYADGPMQDIHWPSGAVGYFPSYTLGAMTAAQLYSAMSSKISNVPELITKGDFEPVFAWLSSNIWEKGCSLRYDDLMTQATGETLTSKFFLDHLRNRYL